MKRFWCPKCRRYVRARSLPRPYKTAFIAKGPSETAVRIEGLCYQHRRKE